MAEIKEEKKAESKSALRDWWESILFAVVVATLFRWLLFEPFVIPTPSMEGTMLVGDVIVVSKFHYGTRTTGTPLQFPLTHQTFWGTDIPSYLTWLKVPMFRLPGFRNVKRMEPVVFNYPYEDQHPTDMKHHWVKRCVGIPGDSVVIFNGDLVVNGEAMPKPPGLQSSYFLATKGPVRERFFESRAINEFYEVNGGYLVHTNNEIAENLRKTDFITGVEEIKSPAYNQPQNHFPEGTPNGWSTDDFGPLWVPKKGETVVLDEQTVPIYSGVIKRFERLQNVEIKLRELYIDGKKATQYTFKQDYYFMMGDNRHNSMDSRSWGFVPEDHIVGKPVMVLFSTEEGPFYTLPLRIRWSRIFNTFD